ncbi:hypothetical protein C7S18_09440 [Ahniella affigens]|uniref:Uncharacterized protein n=1 Tax=Ahniella affigens TaxID=2021234 RepID=A0A2P1PRF2_9GAMM|nr:hypothetical protein [Ahniella affigens]AVP97402.1 hypothetical protein C7S18_09440 [Ahniella affigens]
MSDGPFRSLPLARHWRELAKLAENGNYSREDLADAAFTALEKTWRKDVPAALVVAIHGLFLKPQHRLFASDRVEEVEALSDLAAGRPLGRLLIEHAAMVVQEGLSGEIGMIEATQRTVEAWEARTYRQIEEHYIREAPPSLTRKVRERVWNALADGDRRALARLLFSQQGRVKRPSHARKHVGLDEGVAL